MANLDNPYGVTIGLNPGGTGTPANYAYWTQLIADMHALNMTWCRFQLSWRNIEKTQGTTDPITGEYTVGTCVWTPVDDAVAQCNAAGINISFPIRGAPDWALMNTAMQPTDEPWFMPDPAMIAGFAKAVAQRYNGAAGHGTLNSIEVGNEDWDIHDSAANFTINAKIAAGTTGVTSITTKKLVNDVHAGAVFVLGPILGGAQQVTVSANANKNDTVLHVNSFNASTDYNVGLKCFQIVHALRVSDYYEYYDIAHSGQVTNNPTTQPARDPWWHAQVIAGCSTQIRKYHPRCLVGAGAIWWRSWPNVRDFIDGLYRYVPNFKNVVDYINLHFYSNTADPTLDGDTTKSIYGPSISQTLTAMQGACVARGDTKMRVWLTEYGWSSNANNGDASQIDTDSTTQAYWYAGRNQPGWICDTSVAPSGSAPFYIQNHDYVMETCRKSNFASKIFLFTMDYKTGTTTGQETASASLVQFSTDGLATRTNLPAYAAVQTFSQTFPQWDGSSGGGGGGGSGGVLTKTILKTPIVPGQRRHIVR